jgi:alpha-L-arabinofuranosidase
MVAINRSTTEQSAIISGQPLRGTARRFQITAASAQQQSQIRPVPAGTQPVSGRSLTLKLPPLSVTTVDISL